MKRPVGIASLVTIISLFHLVIRTLMRSYVYKAVRHSLTRWKHKNMCYK